MEHQVPFNEQIVAGIVADMGLDVSTASIREMNNLIDAIEARFQTQFIRMEFGVPGLPTTSIAIDAEVAALKEKGVAHTYAPFSGIPELKTAGATFAKAFLDLDVPPTSVIATNGAMQACFIAQGIAGCHHGKKDTILFLDPGFPVNKLQNRLLGLKSVNLDLNDYRGEALITAVDRLCNEEPIGGCLWSSPNNPAWICLSEDELDGLAQVFDKHGVFAIEDMAYFGMDSRTDYSQPYQPPYQPTIARYMDRVFVIISASKMFSYAGQRCAITIIPPNFAGERFPNLQQRFARSTVLDSFVQGGIYPTTASIVHSAQVGLAALLRATVSGRYNPWQETRTYSERATAMKTAFQDNGFYLVYDNDLGEALADGFYFTIAYPNMSGAELVRRLLHYGVSAITLGVTGSRYTEGLRACVSLTPLQRMPVLRKRLAAFHRDHPIKA